MNEKTQWLSTDILGQIIMFCPVSFLLIGEYLPASFAYFSVGTWQAVSSIRYHRKWPQAESKSRRYYRSSIPFILGFGLIALPLLLVGTPVMALWYFVKTICEFRNESRLDRELENRNAKPAAVKPETGAG